ncbi:MAG: sensor histidine kinase [Verrucomicrobia bacterium]|nr:MAG: sensor histidine kinase [Verrucomicrobiota bacterium]
MRYSERVLGTSSLRREEEPSPWERPNGRDPVSPPPPFVPLKQYLTAVAGVAALTIACWFLTPLTGYASISLIYLLGVLLAGMVLSRGPVLLVATLSALAWNFLFIPPRFTFHIAKLEDALTFATFFIIALTVGSLTAQLKAREHLAAQVQLAKNSERLRKTLLDCVSHELKTPLAAIGAASQELLRLTPNAQNAEMLEQLAGEIHHGSHRLHRVVNNLLDMNRLESGVVQPKSEWCDVRELLQSAVEIERESIDGREIRLDVPDNIPLALLDHGLIEQAVAKLLVNAASYSEPGWPIEIDAEYKQEQLVVCVSDRGPGFPTESTERLFEKFYRGDGRKAGGLGLGLSIARGFVEAHGGKLTAENRDGGGARFTICLPVRATSQNALETAL